MRGGQVGAHVEALGLRARGELEVEQHDVRARRGHRATASAGVPASPTTRRSSSRSRIERSPCRMIEWSSTSTIRVGARVPVMRLTGIVATCTCSPAGAGPGGRPAVPPSSRARACHVHQPAVLARRRRRSPRAACGDLLGVARRRRRRSVSSTAAPVAQPHDRAGRLRVHGDVEQRLARDAEQRLLALGGQRHRLARRCAPRRAARRACARRSACAACSGSSATRRACSWCSA